MRCKQKAEMDDVNQELKKMRDELYLQLHHKLQF